jgi:membrane fusion protein (multidrug efflux system)
MVALCVLADAASAQQPPATVPVGVVKAERKPVSKSAEFVGRIEAINRVEIRARVKGFLEAVLFKEGDTVKENAPLYQIEKGLFQAAVEQAAGALERSKAAHTLAVLQLQRAEDLLAKSAGTVVARDQAVAQEQQARGAMMTDQANLDTAKINLGYTDITAPIAGRIGRTRLTKGNVVGPDSGMLTLIVSQDPMYVTFPVSQRDFLALQASEHQNGNDGAREVKVKIRFSDGRMYDQEGTIDFIGVSVDRTTDTITVRATIPNPRDILIDQQLVRVIVQSATPEEKVVVPQAALIADQEGVYVFAVEGGKAVVKRIRPGSEDGPDIVVEQGLSGGELIVVQGLQALRPGMPVMATPMPQSLGRT